MADRLGVPVDAVSTWHKRHGPAFGTRVEGQTNAKAIRPPGTLSVGDIVTKYEISVQTLARWRREGLPHRRIGKMIVIGEAVLKEWIVERGI